MVTKQTLAILARYRASGETGALMSAPQSVSYLGLAAKDASNTRFDVVEPSSRT